MEILKLTAIVILATIILVVLSYYYVDEPVAAWMVAHHVYKSKLLWSFVFLAIGVDIVALFSLVIVTARYVFNRLSRIDLIFLTAAISVTLAAFMTTALKIAFGRSGTTWVDGYQTVVPGGDYGFHFFQGSPSTAFPAGHVSIPLAAMTVLWLAVPQLRWLAILVSVLQIIGLVGMNDHFVGDTIGGAALGWLCGYYTWLWCRDRVNHAIH